MKMSEIQGQEEYIKTLKQIKEAEDQTQIEIDTLREKVENESKRLDQDLKNALMVANENGKKLVNESIEDARRTASIEADSIINEAKEKSKGFSFKSDPKMIKELIQILLSKL